MLRTILQACRSLLMIGLISGHAWAEEGPESDRELVVEAGPAAERDIKNHSASYGAGVGLEHTPIENWLEMEYGLAILGQGGRRALEADVLFKKPFRVSENVEFMVGLGPSFERRFGGADRGSGHGAEFALDLMVWTTRSVGWFVEPSYGVGLGNSKGERTVGASGGLLLRWQ
jgi:hypothetical protein